MALDGELTILLTLKDRTPFTFRLLSYLNSSRFPFKVLIADGSSDARVADVLSDRVAYPHVDYEYVRYPYDAHYADFYAKVEDALSRVRTPFVAMADNDDFFIVSGVRQAIQFLTDHPEYATCGGQSIWFWVTSSGRDHRAEEGGPYGNHVEWKCSSDAQSHVDETARDRLRNQALRNAYLIYHHVQRTEELRRQFRIARQLDPKDLFLIEYLLSFLTAIRGKTKQLDTPYMARQWNAPGSAGGAHMERSGDWLGRMLVPSWSDDFTKFVTVTATALAERDGLSLASARAAVVAAYRMQIAPALLADVLAEPSVTTPMSLMLRGVRRLLRLAPDNFVRKTARTLYRRVSWISADAVHGTGLWARTVPNAEREFQPIREFLARQARSAPFNSLERRGIEWLT